MSLTIAHRLPGRLRAAAPELRNTQTLRRVERELGALEGVRSATGNQVTGSILIEYDPDTQGEAAVVARLQDVSGIPMGRSGTTPSESEIPAFADAIQAPLQRLNAGLWSLTKGNLDLRFLVPILFAGYGTVKLLRQGPVPSIPWYLLYWWSFRMFVILNRQAENQKQAP